MRGRRSIQDLGELLLVAIEHEQVIMRPPFNADERIAGLDRFRKLDGAPVRHYDIAGAVEDGDGKGDLFQMLVVGELKPEHEERRKERVIGIEEVLDVMDRRLKDQVLGIDLCGEV